VTSEFFDHGVATDLDERADRGMEDDRGHTADQARGVIEEPRPDAGHDADIRPITGARLGESLDLPGRFGLHGRGRLPGDLDRQLLHGPPEVLPVRFAHRLGTPMALAMVTLPTWSGACPVFVSVTVWGPAVLPRATRPNPTTLLGFRVARGVAPVPDRRCGSRSRRRRSTSTPPRGAGAARDARDDVAGRWGTRTNWGVHWSGRLQPPIQRTPGSSSPRRSA